MKYHANRADVYAMQGLIRADLGDLEAAESLLLDALIVDPFYVPRLRCWVRFYRSAAI